MQIGEKRTFSVPKRSCWAVKGVNRLRCTANLLVIGVRAQNKVLLQNYQ